MELDSIIDRFDGDPNIGMIVMRMRDGAILFEHHADRYFIPASVSKLFTGYTALMLLGKDYRYSTPLYRDRDHNLYLKFIGDPTLTVSDLEVMIASLKHDYRIDRVRGGVFIDDMAFDERYWVSHAAWEDRKFCYGAPISAIMVNGNCHHTMLTPARKREMPAQLRSNHMMLLEELDNQAISRYVLHKSYCPLHLTEIGHNAYRITGCIGPKTPPLPLRIAIQNPRMMIVKLVGHLFKKHGILLDQPIRFATVPQDADILVTRESEPLDKLLVQMGHQSNNLIANSLFKHIPFQLYKKQGTFENGREVLNATLQKFTAIDTSKMYLEDGAGMSMNSHLTPRSLVQLLHSAYQNELIRESFIKSLPRNGMEGTLERRMRQPHIKGKVQAKTGGADSVSALSGYVTHPRDGVLAFAILNNGFLIKKKQKQLEDQLLTFLVSGSKK